MKKLVMILSVLLAALLLVSCAPAEPEDYTVRVAALKGPTGMGLVGLWDEVDSGAYPDCSVQLFGTADEIVPKLINGELDVALIPANLAAVLYNRTGGGVLVAAINTLGVLYVVETGDTVQSVADLAGKTVYSTGKGTTPEYALNYVLKGNGVTDATVEFKSEASEIASLLAEGSPMVAVLPQPYVTTVMMKNPAVRIALSLSDEWDALPDDSRLVTGVVAVSGEFAAEHPQALAEFLAAYERSVKLAADEPATVAALCERYGIVAAAVAERALPLCNIVYITGEDMRTALLGYYGALYAFEPASVGGTSIGEDIFIK